VCTLWQARSLPGSARLARAVLAAATAGRIEMLTTQLLMPVRAFSNVHVLLGECRILPVAGVLLLQWPVVPQLGSIATAGLWPLTIAATICAVIGKVCIHH